MAYAIQSDLEATGLSAEIVADLTVAQVSAHLDEASSLVDSYLRGRYSVPLSTVPPSIRKCTVDIAVCAILQSLGYKPEEYDAGYSRRCERAIEWLKDIASGNASLGLVDDTPDVNEGAPRVYSAEPRGW